MSLTQRSWHVAVMAGAVACLASAVAIAQPTFPARPPTTPIIVAQPPSVQPAGPATGTPAPGTPGLARFDVRAPDNDDGTHLQATFARVSDDPEIAIVMFRRAWGTPNPPPSYRTLITPHDVEPRTWSVEFAGSNPPPLATVAVGTEVGSWTVVALLEAGETQFVDEVAANREYEYLAAGVRRTGDGVVIDTSAADAIGPRAPEAALINTHRLGYLGIVLLIGGLIGWYIRVARRKKDLYIRRLPGVDAIEDSIGRSTEMGRPVLYVTGLEEIQNIQTIASLLILGHVAEKTAEYDTDLTVANCYPLTMVVAEEVVRQGYANVGRIDAHRPEQVLFITAEQFAFAAGVSGIILRDRPATNIYFGCFYGESLLLAETGFLTGAVQIAGTAELTQLPFFISACDYTLIGEELYAASAYLTKEPTLLANLKAADAFKILAMLFIVVGVVLATGQVWDLGAEVFP
jgi:hypothetical protein